MTEAAGDGFAKFMIEQTERTKEPMHALMDSQPMDDIATLMGVPDTMMTEDELRYAVRFASKQLTNLYGRKLNGHHA